MKHVLRLLVTIILFSGCAPQAGRVVSIADGDTFTMLGEGNTQIKVRLYGIDCPEKSQAFGNVAKQFTAEKIFGKQVEIEEKDKDRYGRIIAIVHLQDGTTLNEELLKAGLAWHYTAYDDNAKWQELQAAAQERRVGLWQDEDPTPPWEFRKNRRKNNKKKKKAQLQVYRIMNMHYQLTFA
jgi:endonuclease YncB( thermonuclease family)